MATLNNTLSGVLFEGTNDADTLSNYSANYVTIYGYAGNDNIYSHANYVTIYGGAGDDTIENEGRFSIIYAGDGNDSVYTNILTESTFEDATVYGGTGNDTLVVNDHKTLLDGGEGDDVISVQGGDRWKTNTLQGGTGNDTLYGGGSNVFVYNEGDGDDLVKNYKTGDALKINTTFATLRSGNDIIISTAGDGHITLESAYSENVIINDETINGGAGISTMHMSRWSYSFGRSASSTTLTTSEDLVNGGVNYYYGRGSQITYNADENNTVNLFGVTLEQITGANISAGAVNLTFNDGGSLTMLGQSNSQFILNGSIWTADQSTQSWKQTS